jgi:hypothetical protein
VYGDKSRGSHTCATLALPDCTLKVFDIASGKQVIVPMVR